MIHICNCLDDSSHLDISWHSVHCDYHRWKNTQKANDNLRMKKETKVYATRGLGKSHNVLCPFCGSVHTHYLSGNELKGMGSIDVIREASCGDADKGYNIVGVE